MTITRVITSGVCTSEKNAWEYFDEELKYWLYWLKGYKYWRVLPKPQKNAWWQEADHEHKYRVTARIIISEEKIKGYMEVSLAKPYPTELPKHPFEDGSNKFYSFGGKP
jgi:hypothetical protein